MRPGGELNVLWLLIAVSLSLISVRMQTRGESSGEYLQKVMIELQELNVPSSSNLQENLPSSLDYKNILYDDRTVNHLNRVNGKLNANLPQIVKKQQSMSEQNYPVLPTKKIDLDQQYAETMPHRYQSHGTTVTKIKEPEVLGLTRAELAAMYKDAIEKGSAVSLTALTNSLSAGTVPQVTGTHVEFPTKQPMYHYYFFPLKTFASELKKDHGYKTIPAAIFEKTEASTENTQTQLSSPLFVAISTFISMALLFMVGILFLPRLTSYGVIHARSSQDDLLQFSKALVDAIDRYNLSEKFTVYRSDYRRYNEAARLKKKKTKNRKRETKEREDILLPVRRA